jgi:hypothetical protein
MLVFCFLAATLAGAGLCAYASPTAFAKQLADASILSSLTAPGSQPFLLKLEATDTRQRDPQYNAQIEIWWAAPDKWHRQVKSPAFSQTAIQNGLPQAFEACGSITATRNSAAPRGCVPSAPLPAESCGQELGSPLAAETKRP